VLVRVQTIIQRTIIGPPNSRLQSEKFIKDHTHNFPSPLSPLHISKNN
jgi:hypothetical protein